MKTWLSQTAQLEKSARLSTVIRMFSPNRREFSIFLIYVRKVNKTEKFSISKLVHLDRLI